MAESWPLTDGSGFQELAKHVKFWKIERLKRLGQEKPFPASQFYHFKGLSTIESDWFLYKHVLACIQCQHNPFKMEIVRGGHVDHVEVGSSD